jgi:predicted DNA-binding WGR domain protein
LLREIEKQILAGDGAQRYIRAKMRLVVNRALKLGQLTKNKFHYMLGSATKTQAKAKKKAKKQPSSRTQIKGKKTANKPTGKSPNAAQKSNQKHLGGLTRLASKSGTGKAEPHPRSEEHCPDAAVFVQDGTVFDAELNQQDRSKNMDKYYVLQVLQSGESCWLFTHWGRTGAAGQINAQEFHSIDKAIDAFCKTFKQKTSCAWDDRALFVRTPGKYHWLQRSYTNTKRDASVLSWQYHLTNDPQGKPDGWYNYDGKIDIASCASSNMEDYWEVFQSNSWLDVRFVTSGSFTYKVNFGVMTQMNTSSSKVRPIRRQAAVAPPSGSGAAPAVAAAVGVGAVGRLLAQMNPRR